MGLDGRAGDSVELVDLRPQLARRDLLEVEHQRHRGSSLDAGRGGGSISSRSTRKEHHMPFELPDLPVCLRRARAPHRRRDDADPPRPAPQGLRRQRERRARRHVACRRRQHRFGADQPRDPARREAGPGPEQRRRPREPQSLLADHEPRRRRRTVRRPREGDRRDVRELRRAQGRGDRRRRQALRQRLDVARVGRHRSLALLDAESGLADPAGRLAAARNRRLGACVLPQVSRTSARPTSKPGGTSSTGTRSDGDTQRRASRRTRAPRAISRAWFSPA